jgi:hypothetical protein
MLKSHKLLKDNSISITPSTSKKYDKRGITTSLTPTAPKRIKTKIFLLMPILKSRGWISLRKYRKKSKSGNLKISPTKQLKKASKLLN